MILHPDGRIEGTPEEILKYKELISPASCPDDEECEDDPEAPSSEELQERLIEATHAAKTPISSGWGGINVIKNDFLKGIPWVEVGTKEPIPGSVTPVVQHAPDHNCNCCSCRLATKYLR